MAAPRAPFLDAARKKSEDVTLTADVCALEGTPQLIHETVRAEAAAARSGSQSAKSRGLVAGGRSKPWRQKGTGRARAGTTRAPHWTGGGVAFPPAPRSFEVKVNRKARRAALRGALAAHASRGTIALLDASGFDKPSTQLAARLLESGGMDVPVVVVANEDEDGVLKSFRNLKRVVVMVPSDLEVSAVVWARSLLVSEAALEAVQGAAKPPVRASGSVEGAGGNREVPPAEASE